LADGHRPAASHDHQPHVGHGGHAGHAGYAGHEDAQSDATQHIAEPGTHVMPDGTVMKGSHCDHAHHSTGHDHAGHAHHHPAAVRPVPQGDLSQVEYTCPMHPQVRQMGPGNCPICGMALEPVWPLPNKVKARNSGT
jgi:hypothetical protein